MTLFIKLLPNLILTVYTHYYFHIIEIYIKIENNREGKYFNN